MDIDALKAMVPDRATWYGMDDEPKKKFAESLLGMALDRIAAEGRELDDWEKKSLAYAAVAIRHRAYALAVNEVLISLTPPSGRSEQFVIGDDARKITIDDIRKELQCLQGMPAGR